MDTLLELDNFILSKVAIIWHSHKLDSFEYKSDLSYDLKQNINDASRYRLSMQVEIRSDSEIKAGYEIQSEIIGLFSCPSDLEEAKKQRLLHYNGLSILYGILRGELANVTGSFRGGKYILPTANMAEVIRCTQAKQQKGEELKIISESSAESK